MTVPYATDGTPAQVYRTDGTIVWGGGGSTPGPDPEPDPWPLPASGTEITLTTYDGSDATCHPSVVDMLAETGDVWNGYRWWLADTPYIGPPHPTGSTIENPCIWASNDRIHWVEPAPGVNPLEPWPGEIDGTYNSDTELAWDPDGQRLVMYWRHTTLVRAGSSTDGTNWALHGQILDPQTVGRASPTVVRMGDDDWRMWQFGDTDFLASYHADNPLGPWTYMGETPLIGYEGGMAWHGGVTAYKGVLIGVFDTRHGNAARPIASSDGGMTFTVGPLTPNLNGYRSTLTASTRAGYVDSWHGRLGQNRPLYRLNPERVWMNLL